MRVDVVRGHRLDVIELPLEPILNGFLLGVFKIGSDYLLLELVEVESTVILSLNDFGFRE